MLRELACDTGLVKGVAAVLADTYVGPWQHAPGQVFTDLAVAIADGGDCVSSGGRQNQGVSLYYASVSLQAGKTVRYLALPDVGAAATGGLAMHVFAIAVG